MDGLRQCRSFSRLGLLSVLLRFAISRSKFQLLAPRVLRAAGLLWQHPNVASLQPVHFPLPVAHACCETPHWWMLRPIDQSARQPHRHGRAEAVPKLLQVGTAERAATLCDLPFQISTSCSPSAPCCRAAVTTPQRCKSSTCSLSVARCHACCDNATLVDVKAHPPVREATPSTWTG